MLQIYGIWNEENLKAYWQHLLEATPMDKIHFEHIYFNKKKPNDTNH